MILAVTGAAGVLLRPERCLVAECAGKRLFAWPISAGESFEVTFIHSLNLSPITDVIEWSGDELIVRKSVFRTFGAGVPIPADGVGEELLFIDGHYELIGINKHMSGFTIMTQDIPNHIIAFNGREARLLDYVGPGKAVDIAVRRVSRLWLHLHGRI